MVYESSYPNYLEHYGVKGMKWGVIRSPKELLSSRNKRVVSSRVKTVKKTKAQKEAEEKAKKEAEEKKKQEERVANKDKILASRNAKKIYDNRDLFTTKELQEAYARLVVEANIKKMKPEEKNKVQEFIKKYVDTAKTAKEILDATKGAYDSITAFKKMLESMEKNKK